MKVSIYLIVFYGGADAVAIGRAVYILCDFMDVSCYLLIPGIRAR